VPKELFCLWSLFWISTISSTGELITAWYFANSASAQADSIHALLHSAWYWTAIYENRKFGHSIFSVEEDKHPHHKFTIAYACLFFASLVFVLIEAILKIFHPNGIIANYMLYGVGIGILGNVASLWIISRMKPKSDSNKRFDQMWLHAKADLWISIPVLIYAIILCLLPSYPFLNLIDPVLTFTIVIYLGVNARPAFSNSFKQVAHNHHH